MDTLDNNELELLKQFYCTLRSNLRKKGKSEKNNSVLIALLETKRTTIYELRNQSIIPVTLNNEKTLLSLLDKKLIQVQANVNNYVITAKGIWQYENTIGGLDEDILLSYINQKFLGTDDPNIKNGLDDKAKVILLAMIGARAFSEASKVDLKKGILIKDKWVEVIESSHDLLKNMGIISKPKQDMLISHGNEHVANYLFRHNDYYVQKTRQIYQFKKGYEYYLDIYSADIFSNDNLTFLFWKIFAGKGIDSYENVLAFLNETSKKGIYLFDMNNHIFASPVYDQALRTCLLNSYIEKDKWAKIDSSN